MDSENAKGDEEGTGRPGAAGFSTSGLIKGPVRRQRRTEPHLGTSGEAMRSADAPQGAAALSQEDDAPTINTIPAPKKGSGANKLSQKSNDKSKFLPAPFVFKCELGRGGMGVVYRAFDPVRNHDVAIKFLPETGVETQITRRFQREAHELAAMSHPNVVAFYGAGRHETRDFLVMELVDGGNLHDVVKSRGGKLPVVEAANLFVQISEGLAHIHDQGLVHRDFKPENILLTPAGVPKITDFGLARRMEERSRLTSAGTIIGTYSYLAPEQILSSDVGPAADLYAMGCCLYEVLLGRPIFTAETEFALLNSHLREVPVALRTIDPSIPPELEALVLKLVRKAPEERPASAHEVCKILKAFLAKTAPQAAAAPERGGVLGRQDIIRQLEQVCTALLSAAKARAAGEPPPSVSCLLTAASGHGRSVVVRELVTSLRTKGLKVITAVPQFGKDLPLRDVYVALGGDSDAFARRLHHGGPRAAVLALRDALERSPEPVLLVADDFLRLSATTNQMLQCLAALEPPPGHGWLLSCASARAASLSLWPGVVRMELPPLASDKMMLIAEQELGAPLEKPVQDWLTSRASGSVRRLRLYLYALQGGPYIALQKGLWAWMEGSAPPANFVEPIVAALGQGPESDLKFLRAACLTEEPFPFEVVAVAAGLAEDEADQSIDRLCRRGLFEESWGAKGEHFYVASPEIKEAVLRGLSERTRKRLHGRIVEAMGRRANPAIRGRHEVAAQLGADALAHVTEGATAYDAAGAFAEATELWLLAHDVVQNIEVPELRWRVDAGTVESMWKSGNVEEALRIADVALKQPVPLGGAALTHYQNLLGLQVRLAWLGGQPPERMLARCRELSEAAGPHNLWLAVTQAEVLEALGQKAEALEVLESLSGRPHLPALHFLLKGRLLRALGRFKEATIPIHEALDRPDYLSVDEYYALQWEAAECQLGLRALSEALESIDQAITACLAAQERDWEARFWGLRGRCCELMGDWDEATQSFRDGVECARGHNARLAESLVSLGLHLVLRRQLAEGESTLREVMQNPQGERYGLQASLGLAIACLLAERYDESHEWLSQANNCGAPAAALLLQAEVARQQSNSAMVAELLERVNSHLRPATLELGMALALKGLLGHAVDREQVLKLLIEAPSLTPGDPLRAIRSDWVDRVESMVFTSVPAGIEFKVTAESKSGKLTPPPEKVPLKSNEAPLVEVGLPTVLMGKAPPEKSKSVEAGPPVAPPPRPQPPQAEIEEEADESGGGAGGGNKKAFAAVGLAALALVAGLLVRPLIHGGGDPSPSPTLAAVTPSETPGVVTPTPTPTPEALVLDTIPDKGQIVLLGPDGKEVAKGTAPLTCPLHLPGGEYQARITRDGCLPYQSNFHLDESMRSRTFPLEQLGKIRLQFARPPVVVRVDNDEARITVPTWEKELKEGNHKIVISAEGFVDKPMTVKIEGGKTLELPEVKLEVATAEITMETVPPGAMLVVDGKAVGRTSDSGPNKGTSKLTRLKLGSHKIKAKLDGYEDEVVELNLKAGKNDNKTVTLRKIVVAPPPEYHPPPRPPVERPYVPPVHNNPPPTRPITRPDDI